MSGNVELFTGLPGSGKTASLVKRITQLQEKEPGRPVFQYGINGLKDGLAMPLTPEMLEKWWELPPGSIICIDECQEEDPVKLMPKDRGNPAEWVQRITKVRHYGMTFLLTTQHPANMSAYVRRLVDTHVHSVMRSKGVRQTYTWQRCMDDPDNRSAKKTGEMSFQSLPKEVFDLYKSSSLHTSKVRTPRSMYLLAGAAVLAVVLAVYIPYRLHAATHDVPHVDVAALGGVVPADTLREKDYVKWTTPRVAGVPWSAPMFDKLSVKTSPRLFCIAVDDGRCDCLTEQGTKFAMSRTMCRTIAANGMYNPFADQLSESRADSSNRSADERTAGPDGGPAALRPAHQPGQSGEPGGVIDGDLPKRPSFSYVGPQYVYHDVTPLADAAAK